MNTHICSQLENIGNYVTCIAKEASRIFDEYGTNKEKKDDSFLNVKDFGAVGDGAVNDTTAIQHAIDTANLNGGGTVFLPSGKYKCNKMLTLYSNIHLYIDRSAVLDFTDCSSYTCIYAEGSVGSEVKTSVNLTKGDSVIETRTPHGLSVGDWVVIIGQRVCGHKDAGVWRLGSQTAGTKAPYFGEPLNVYEVNSDTSFTATSRLLFPDYRTDGSQETCDHARQYTSIRKIDFCENLKITGGTIIAPKPINEAGKTIIRLYQCRNADVKIDKIELSASPSVAIFAVNCLCCDIKAYTVRDPSWVITSNHSVYNVCKDVSGWYNRWDLKDENGSQGFDQTFISADSTSSNAISVCAIYPTVKMYSVNAKESGLTTHGCCYGAYLDVTAINPGVCCLSNRTPHATIIANCVNHKGTANSAIKLLDHGMLHTVVRDSYISRCGYGIDIDPGAETSGPTDYLDGFIDAAHLTIRDIKIEDALYTPVFFRKRIDKYGNKGIENCDVEINGLSLHNCSGTIYVDDFWHGARINNIVISGIKDDTSIDCCIYIRNSLEVSLSDVTIIDVPENIAILRVFDGSLLTQEMINKYGQFMVNVYENSIKRFGNGEFYSGAINYINAINYQRVDSANNII